MRINTRATEVRVSSGSAGVEDGVGRRVSVPAARRGGRLRPIPAAIPGLFGNKPAETTWERPSGPRPRLCWRSAAEPTGPGAGPGRPELWRPGPRVTAGECASDTEGDIAGLAMCCIAPGVNELAMG